MPAFSQLSALNSQLPRRSRGFTLLELLVAAAITALLATFIAVIIGNVARTWSRASGRLGADAKARLVLDQLQLDLQGAIFREDGNVWMAADLIDTTTNPGNLWIEATSNNRKPTGTGANGSINLTPANLADCRFGKAGIWLRFFTTRRGTNDPASATTSVNTASAPVAVGYQIIRRYAATNATNIASLAYLLHRAEVRPAAVGSRPGVLESGYNLDPAATTHYTRNNLNGVSNDGSQTGDPRSLQIPGTNTGGTGGARNLDAVIADHVIDFGLRCYVRDATQPGGLRLIFPASATGALVNNPPGLRSQLPASTSPADPAYDPRFLMPDVVDVMLRVLTDAGAAQLANMERVQTPALVAPQKYNNILAAWWWGVATENSRVFTRRIVLNAKPL